jgi:transcriptional regulator with XRE-family HTH domain
VTGKELKKLRLKAGLTQKELGSLLDVEQCQISDFERGRRKITRIKEIAFIYVCHEAQFD